MSDSVKIYFMGGLEKYAQREGVCEEPASVGSVQGLLDALALPDHRVGTALINGKYASRDAAVSPGDEVALFPPRG